MAEKTDCLYCIPRLFYFHHHLRTRSFSKFKIKAFITTFEKQNCQIASVMAKGRAASMMKDVGTKAASLLCFLLNCPGHPFITVGSARRI